MLAEVAAWALPLNADCVADVKDGKANSLTFVGVVFRMNACLYRERCD